MIRIRLAKPADRQSILTVYKSATNQAGHTGSDWELLIDNGGMLVAEEEAAVVAFGGIDVGAPEQLKYLYVLPQYQRSGIGSRLLAQLEEIGWQAGVDSLRLHSAPPAVEFYRRHGYREAEEGEQIGHDHEGLEMVKRKAR